jgi:hypothetical protein
MVAALSVVWPSMAPALSYLGAYTARLAPAADMVMATLRAQLPIVLGVAAFLIAAPVALYFALREE